jgi:hypothetical protein
LWLWSGYVVSRRRGKGAAEEEEEEAIFKIEALI